MLVMRSRGRDSRHQYGQTRVHSARLSGGDNASIARRLWELEALIAAGCDLTEALTVISARRNSSVGEGVRPAIAEMHRANLS
jgi:uncharacterized protein with PIN domain